MLHTFSVVRCQSTRIDQTKPSLPSPHDKETEELVSDPPHHGIIDPTQCPGVGDARRF